MLQRIKDRSRQIILVFVDLFSMSIGYWLILHRVGIIEEYLDFSNVLNFYLVMIGCVISFRFLLKVYRQMWRYASSDVYLLMVVADMIGGLTYLAIDRFIFIYHLSFPNTVAAIGIGLLMTLSARFVYQFLRKRPELLRLPWHDGSIERVSSAVDVAIVGAGDLGAMLARELLSTHSSRYRPTYFIDNDPKKIGSMIEGIKVIGPDKDAIRELPSLSVQAIILTMPNMDMVSREEIIKIYLETGCKVLVYDYASDQLDHDDKRTIRDINIEDLLFREPVIIQGDETSKYYKDKTILITGAGGSIGSELSRQLAAMQPKKLVLLDVYENGVYDVEQELKRRYSDGLSIEVVIASICNQTQIERIFERIRPQIVFHAAAHKHVPLMESNCVEAVQNNVLGTYNTINAAELCGTERFVMISTDKAVNPTNIMGATKRMCEMIIQSRKDSKTDFVAVRFGNVLGSNGSVIPLFKQQIAEGGPVTITDKRIIRYFMTIPEAAQLVIRSGRRAEKSEIYVLDMGKPIRIYDLALKLIYLSGLKPGVDIEVKEVGLRPGEKLYEELLVKNEDCESTEEDRIFIERQALIDRQDIEHIISILRKAIADEVQDDDMRALMKKLVPNYFDPDAVNDHADEAQEIRDARVLGDTAQLSSGQLVG